MQPATVLTFLGLAAFVLASPVMDSETFSPANPEAPALVARACSAANKKTCRSQCSNVANHACSAGCTGTCYTSCRLAVQSRCESCCNSNCLTCG